MISRLQDNCMARLCRMVKLETAIAQLTALKENSA